MLYVAKPEAPSDRHARRRTQPTESGAASITHTLQHACRVSSLLAVSFPPHGQEPCAGRLAQGQAGIVHAHRVLFPVVSGLIAPVLTAVVRSTATRECVWQSVRGVLPFIWFTNRLGRNTATADRFPAMPLAPEQFFSALAQAVKAIVGRQTASKARAPRCY